LRQFDDDTDTTHDDDTTDDDDPADGARRLDDRDHAGADDHDADTGASSTGGARRERER
jgi:hypothetical protein